MCFKKRVLNFSLKCFRNFEDSGSLNLLNLPNEKILQGGENFSILENCGKRFRKIIPHFALVSLVPKIAVFDVSCLY